MSDYSDALRTFAVDQDKAAEAFLADLPGSQAPVADRYVVCKVRSAVAGLLANLADHVDEKLDRVAAAQSSASGTSDALRAEIMERNNMIRTAAAISASSGDSTAWDQLMAAYRDELLAKVAKRGNGTSG